MEFLELLKIIGVLIVLYFIGKLLRSFFSKSENNNLFYSGFSNLLLGLISVITVFSIIKTNFNTISLGFILIAIIYFIKEKPKISTNKFSHFFEKDDLKIIGVISILAFLFFLIPYFLYYNTPYNNLPQGDYYFYSKLIHVLSEKGVESSTYLIHPFFEGKVGASPYHYVEMWLAVIFVSIFKILTIDAAVVHTNIVLNTILALSMLSISQHIIKSYLGNIIAILGLFFSGIFIYNFIPQVDSFIDFGSVFTSKYSIISIFFALFILQTIKNKKLALLPLLLLPIVNIALAPAVFSSICIFLLYEIIKKRSLRKFLPEISAVLVTALFVALFYYVQVPMQNSPFNIEDIILIHKSNPIQIIKVFAGALAIISVLYFIYLLPFLTIKKSKIKQEILQSEFKILLQFFLIILLVSAFLWSIMHPMHDSVQFYYLSSYLFLNLLITTLFIVALKLVNQNIIRKSIFISLVFIIVLINVIQLPTKAFFKYSKLYQTYSVIYIESVVDEMKNCKKTGVFLKSNNKIKTSFQANPYWISRPPLDHFFPEFNLINIGVNEYELADNDLILELRFNSYMKNAPFNLFINEVKENLSSDELRIKFIEDFNIDYLICQKGAEPPQGLNYKKKIEDEVSGECFYLIY